MKTYKFETQVPWHQSSVLCGRALAGADITKGLGVMGLVLRFPKEDGNFLPGVSSYCFGNCWDDADRKRWRTGRSKCLPAYSCLPVCLLWWKPNRKSAGKADMWSAQLVPAQHSIEGAEKWKCSDLPPRQGWYGWEPPVSCGLKLSPGLASLEKQEWGSQRNKPMPHRLALCGPHRPFRLWGKFWGKCLDKWV